MTRKHEKSSCCRREIIHFGGRRRQCKLCRRTWRVWQRHRGRKQTRTNQKLLMQYLDGHFASIRREAKRRRISESALRRRLKKNAQHFVDAAPWESIPQQNDQYILVADAMIKRINYQWWTIYCMAVRSCKAKQAILLPPVVKTGREVYQGWQAALETLPLNMRKNIKILICDGHRGLIYCARWNGWRIQRCQAHIIFAISGRRSHSFWSFHREEGRKLYALAKTIITTKSSRKLSQAIHDIEIMRQNTSSPILKRVLRGLIRSVGDYRTCLDYPELNIPTTNNAMESFLSQFQELCHRARGFSSVESLKLWITAFAKYKKHITCNGSHQPKKRR